MKKFIFYTILVCINLILIFLDILRPFIGLVRLLAYINLIGLGFCYFIYDQLPLPFIVSSVICFTLFYAYPAIIEFFAGVKIGMLNANNQE